MRAKTLQNSGGRIVKSYGHLPKVVEHRYAEYLGVYESWLAKHGFVVPATEVSFGSNGLQINQQYITGLKPSVQDWTNLSVTLSLIDDYQRVGLDANPNNFIFTKNGVYFVDFMPLLIKDDAPFLRAQFDYELSEVRQRYFIKVNVLVCYLNRLKKLDEAAFSRCLVLVKKTILDDIASVLPRDLRRLEKALLARQDDYESYYQSSKPDTTPMSRQHLASIVRRLEVLQS